MQYSPLIRLRQDFAVSLNNRFQQTGGTRDQIDEFEPHDCLDLDLDLPFTSSYVAHSYQHPPII